MSEAVDLVGTLVAAPFELAGALLDLDSGSSYTPGPSENEAHAKKIANELAEMKEKQRDSTEKLEGKLMDYINKSMSDFLGELEPLNGVKYGGESLRINIDGIRETNEGLKKEVAGHIGRVLDERLVLTDPELSEILKERDDEKRAKSFRAFVLRVRNEAIVSLQDQIRTATTAQSDVVREEIQNRLEEVNHRMDEVQHAYEDIIKAKNGRSSELEEKRMQYMYTYTLYQTISDELKGEG